MSFDDDRPRGVLSPADRAYLLGTREMSHEQSKRNAAARIRKRVRQAVLDFGLLVHALPEKDRTQVFAGVEDDAFVDGLAAMLSFVYLGLREQGVPFERVLVPAVEKAEETYAATTLGTSVEADVTFDVARDVGPGVADVAASVERGDPVTPRELFSLVVRGGDDLAGVESVLVQSTAGDDEGFLDRLAGYLGAEVEQRPLNRALLHLPEEGAGLRGGRGERDGA